MKPARKASSPANYAEFRARVSKPTEHKKQRLFGVLAREGINDALCQLLLECAHAHVSTNPVFASAQRIRPSSVVEGADERNCHYPPRSHRARDPACQRRPCACPLR